LVFSVLSHTLFVVVVVLSTQLFLEIEQQQSVNADSSLI
jgi:hypothetical protein